MIKAAFFDLDETVYSFKKKQVPKSCLKAFELLKKNGILTFLCTGRSKTEIKQVNLDGLVLTGTMSSCGQIVYDQNDNLIYENPFEADLADIVVKLFEEKKIATYLLTYDDLYLNFMDDNVDAIQKDVGIDNPPVKQYHGEKIYMASSYFHNKEEMAIIDELKKYASITFWHDRAIDILPLGASKSSGIDQVIKKYGIKIEETIGFGDGENDLEMIKHCGIGVAMGNSAKIVKDNADYITTDIDDDGIYNALKNFNLI